jgi:hypothetical protein
MNRTGAESSYWKQEKLDCPVRQTGWSGFVDFDISQGHRRYSMRELLFWPSNVWTEDRQEPWQPKGLRRWIIDLIYEKKKN